MSPMSRVRGSARSGQVAFTPRARLLKLIGAELISDDVLAITELVKNAHDADATSAWIDFHDVTGPDGIITVRDDGHGMDLDALLGCWMEPAGTLKASKRGRRTRSGRRVLGEKGVGRFAADKLGSQLELFSRTRRSREELRAVFDWDAFDDRDAKLADIKTRWELRSAQALEGPGTLLVMSGLRSRWNERMFRRLSSRLARLRPPFERGEDGFGIWIESDEFPDYSGQVRTEFLDRAPYRVDAAFDGEQTVRVDVNGSSSQEHRWHGSGDLRCGPVRLRLFGFDLDSLASLGPKLEARAWLREWSGISLYRDGFRVWPYGEPQDDWLRLDQRRVNNPTVRLSNNQVVGFVEITRDANPGLTDQTNREGLIHNRAHEDLRRLVLFVLQLLEAERQSLRHPREVGAPAANSTVRKADSATMSALSRLESHFNGEPDARRLVEAVKSGLERDRLQRGQLHEAYSELAALGQSALEFSTAAQPLLDRAYRACVAIEASNGDAGSVAGLVVSELRDALDALTARLVALKIVDAAARYRSRNTDVGAELQVFRLAVIPTLGDRGVRLSLSVDADRALLAKMRPENLHRLMHILLANTLDWLHRVDGPHVRLSVRDRGDSCEVYFNDNGPGIQKAMSDRVFEPHFSGREGGRGMGLTIARDIVEQHKGSIDVIHDRRRRGATFRIQLPVRQRRVRR